MNSCVNSPEDGPVGPKHVEIRRYMNKIEKVTSVGFSFLMHFFVYHIPSCSFGSFFIILYLYMVVCFVYFF